ncbi:MAG: hypothetical protein MJE68_00925 [Proteobacteria bacterium]|nr:hypothetical protein [Pseudomonadota bacterium]
MKVMNLIINLSNSIFSIKVEPKEHDGEEDKKSQIVLKIKRSTVTTSEEDGAQKAKKRKKDRKKHGKAKKIKADTEPKKEERDGEKGKETEAISIDDSLENSDVKSGNDGSVTIDEHDADKHQKADAEKDIHERDREKKVEEIAGDGRLQIDERDGEKDQKTEEIGSDGSVTIDERDGEKNKKADGEKDKETEDIVIVDEKDGSDGEQNGVKEKEMETSFIDASLMNEHNGELAKELEKAKTSIIDASITTEWDGELEKAEKSAIDSLEKGDVESEESEGSVSSGTFTTAKSNAKSTSAESFEGLPSNSTLSESNGVMEVEMARFEAINSQDIGMSVTLHADGRDDDESQKATNLRQRADDLVLYSPIK